MTTRRHSRPKNLIYNQTFFFSSMFFFVAFVTFEYTMRNVYSLRVFFSLATSQFVELFLKTSKETSKIYGHYCCFLGLVLFGVNISFNARSKDVRFFVHFLTFGLEKIATVVRHRTKVNHPVERKKNHGENDVFGTG